MTITYNLLIVENKIPRLIVSASTVDEALEMFGGWQETTSSYATSRTAFHNLRVCLSNARQQYIDGTYDEFENINDVTLRMQIGDAKFKNLRVFVQLT